MSSGCGDVLSLADLQTAKKHQLFEAEVITGKQGGVSSGANIDYATNQVTGQVQKTMPAILRDIGFAPASFDFSTGGTLGVNDRNKAVYDPASQTWYSYKGTLPVTVPAGFNPVGNANWSPLNDKTWQDELAAPDGAAKIGMTQGRTVQQTFDNFINPKLDFLSRPTMNADYTLQTIVGVTDREGEASAAIKADAGRSDGAFPQGIATDPSTGEIFITRGWDDTTPTYVHIYDKDMNFLKVVKAGGGFSEGLAIGYVGTERRIALTRAGGVGYAVYTVPPTASIGGLNAATLVFESNNTETTTQISSYGKFALVGNKNHSTDQYLRRGLYNLYYLDDFLSNVSPARRAFIHMPYEHLGGGGSDTEAWVTKGQASCISPRGVAAVAGSAYLPGDANKERSGHRLKFLEVSHAGDVINLQQLHPTFVLDEYTAKGWTRPGGQPLDNTEPEGICYSNSYGYLWMSVISERVFITTQQTAATQLSRATNYQLDFRKASMPQGYNPPSMRSVDVIRPINDTNGADLVTADQICDMMRERGMRYYSTTLINALTFGTETHTGVFNVAEFMMVDGNQVAVKVTLNRSNVYQYFASGNTPRSWSAGPTVRQGAPLSTVTNGRNSLRQVETNGTANTRIVASGANALTAFNFVNETNGQIGSIAMGASGTTYNQTSDVRRKNDHGEITGALSILDKMVEDNAFRMAAFKSEPGDIMPMLMAQNLAKSAPYAVTEGGEDEKENPWMVDPSKLVPLLLAMIYELHQKLK